MRYWIELYIWDTWQKFLEGRRDVSGFRARRWRTVQRMNRGDILLCYLTGISRFIGILEVTGDPFWDSEQRGIEAGFPARVPVRVVLTLRPEHAVPVKSLSAELSYFQNLKSPTAWSGYFRGAPREEKPEDAKVIIAALEDAHRNPVFRDFDPKKLKRKLLGYETKSVR